MYFMMNSNIVVITESRGYKVNTQPKRQVGVVQRERASNFDSVVVVGTEAKIRVCGR